MPTQRTPRPLLKAPQKLTAGVTAMAPKAMLVIKSVSQTWPVLQLMCLLFVVQLWPGSFRMLFGATKTTDVPSCTGLTNSSYYGDLKV
jgi:hypothetical protein